MPDLTAPFWWSVVFVIRFGSTCPMRVLSNQICLAVFSFSLYFRLDPYLPKCNCWLVHFCIVIIGFRIIVNSVRRYSIVVFATFPMTLIAILLIEADFGWPVCF